MTTKYFKGTSKKDGIETIYVVYNQPYVDVFGETIQVEASKLHKTGITHYSSVDDALRENFISHQISKNEFESYKMIQHLLTEMYLHDYSGGFPRKENVLDICNRLPGKIKAWLEEI